MKTTYCAKFVNVYLIDRAYGGPEEGGWWYNCGEAIRSTQAMGSDCHGPIDPDNEPIDALLGREKKWCDAENAKRRSDISSVLSEGRYIACIEDEPATDFPTERPHYE